MRGVITFVFDDGYEAVHEHVLPLLHELNLPAVFAVPLDTAALAKTVSEPVRPWQDWLHVRSSGHEIAAHGITHTDLRQLSATDLDKELRLPRETLSATTLVYPGGAQNDIIIKQAKKYYTAARTTNYGLESIPAANPWRLTTVDYTRDNFSLLKANTRALWAAITGRWLIETYHMVYPATGGVDNQETNMHHSVRFHDFKKHLEFVQRLPIQVKTIHETVRDSHN